MNLPYDLVYTWFDCLTSKGHFINGYVIMPNHVHVLIGIRNSKTSLASIVGNAKRLMACEIVSRLQKQGEIQVLKELSSKVLGQEKRWGKLHHVFERSFECKECYNEKFTETKLNYVHQNPCAGKWMLAASPIEYKHSSARFYETGRTRSL